MARDGYPENEIMKRIQAQMPLEEKVKRAHKVIDNSGSIENTKMQTYELFEGCKAKTERLSMLGGRFDERRPGKKYIQIEDATSKTLTSRYRLQGCL